MRPGASSLVPVTTSPAPTERTLTPGPVGRPRTIRRIVACALFVVAVAAYAGYVLIDSGTPPGDVAAYALYWGLWVVAPGTLVFKALRGTAGSWVADLALGAAMGLGCELAAWAIASSTDLSGLLRFWPLLTLVAFTRRRIRAKVVERPTRPWSLPTLAVLAAACVQVVWHVNRTYLQVTPLPPSSRFIYDDLMWHLGLVNEATRGFPLGTPQAVEEGLLVYHWFSDAHIASASLISGVDTTMALLRLWVLPLVALTVLLTAVLARRVGASDWAAAGAAALVSTTVTVPFWPSMWVSSNHLSPLSPSQQFSTPMTLFLVYALVDLLRARPGSRRAQAALVAVTALAASGTKSSALPIVLGGVALATVAALVLRRDRRILLILCGAGVAVTAAAHQFVAGGSFGAGLQLFSALSLLQPYVVLHGRNEDFTTPVLAGVVDTPGVGPMLLLGLLLISALMVLRLLASLLPLFQRALRRDVSAWLLSGICLAAIGPFLGLGHIGYSEYYFVFGALPFGCVLAMWSLSALVRDNEGSARTTVLTATGAAIATVVLGWVRLRATHDISRAAILDDLRWFVISCVSGVIILLAGVAVVLLRRRRGDARWVPVPLAAIVAMAAISGPLHVAVSKAADVVAAPPREYPVALAESSAALWIKQHVPLHAVVATNAQCRNAPRNPCKARMWWIAGLGARQVLVEGWDYLPNATNGFPDQELYRLNQAAFENPTRESVRQLSDRGVTWLVAEAVPRSRPSDRLGQFARERYRDGPIVIYELPASP